ncbi:hypothetical protein [Clostridium sporogenes]|uniref:hypothetical protein n=1 Tax=Clostridium TaxID=1485 RepID=UPI0022378181|nr:hypothetical protein [Clostridium sporogenes]MCW6074486.1 hypothetical protein [Clostridium sporogenes]
MNRKKIISFLMSTIIMGSTIIAVSDKTVVKASTLKNTNVVSNKTVAKTPNLRNINPVYSSFQHIRLNLSSDGVVSWGSLPNAVSYQLNIQNSITNEYYMIKGFGSSNSGYRIPTTYNGTKLEKGVYLCYIIVKDTGASTIGGETLEFYYDGSKFRLIN